MARLGAALAAAVLGGCSDVTAGGISTGTLEGTFVLETVVGRGPATGQIILTRQGYAERRVRFTETNGGMSKEYLSRGTAELNSDQTIDLELKEITINASEPWRPRARLVGGKVELRHPDPGDGPDIVETYRRK